MKLLLEVWRKNGSYSLEAAAITILFIAVPGFGLMLAWGPIQNVGNVPNQEIGLTYDLTHLILPILGMGLLGGAAYFSFFLIPALVKDIKHQLAHKIDQAMDEPEKDWQHKVA